MSLIETPIAVKDDDVPLGTVPNLPMLDPDQLKSLVAIAETGNLTRAAEAVFRTPSAISMQIKKLEETLGKKVLFRTSREVSLTPEGEQLLHYARRLLALNREAVLNLRKPALEGVVRIGAPDDYGARFLPAILAKFNDCYPGVVVDVVIDLSTELVKRYHRKTLDVVLVSCGIGVEIPFKSRIVLREELVWAGLKGGCAYQQRPLPVSMWEAGCAWRNAAIKGLDGANIPYRQAFVSAHSTGQRAALLADLAIAPFPKSLLEPPLVELDREETGLPPLTTYEVALAVQEEAGEATHMAAETIAAQLEKLPDNLLNRAG